MLTFLLTVLTALLGLSYAKDLTLEPGHLKPFGEGRPSQPVPEMEKFPNPEYFFENFVKPLKPLKMIGAAKYSAAFKKWTDNYLMSRSEYDDATVNVETVKKENRNQDVKMLSFHEFVKTYNDSEMYMVDGVPSFLSNEVTVPCPLQCDSLLDSHLVENVMWFSSGGTKSVVHTDSVDNINCLFRGKKKLVFVDPAKYGDKVDMDKPHGAYCNVDVDSVDYTKYPGLADVEFYHVEVSAGDCLYIPYKWIHQVRSYGSNLAVNVWWRHHLTEDLNYSRCNNPCDSRLTLYSVDFQGFDQMFDDLQPGEMRIEQNSNFISLDRIEQNWNEISKTVEFMEHLLTMTRAGHDYTWQDFANSLVNSGYSLSMEIQELQTKVKELFNMVDTNKDGLVVNQEIKDAPDELFEQAIPLLREINILLKEEGGIDIDGDDADDDGADDVDPDETDRSELPDGHDEL